MPVLLDIDNYSAGRYNHRQRRVRMKHKVREYPQFSACGLNCGLCPRYYTKGHSKCPGCGGEGFTEIHCSCSMLSCCQRKGLEYCFMCDEYPCKKYDGEGMVDSFITHMNIFRDADKAKQIGIEAYKAQLDIKIKILEELLENYDDGRRKSFYCLAVNLLEQDDIDLVMEQIKDNIDSQSPLKEKAKVVTDLFHAKADEKGIMLKLRK